MQRDVNRDWALRLTEAGLSIFPCGADKKPLVKWRTLSSSDPEAIAQWWHEFPGALPGIDLEKCDLVVLDGDRHGGPDGVKVLRDLLQRQNGFDGRATPAAFTPNSGVHVYFTENGYDLTNARGDLPAGVDVRGAGGYIVAPYAVLPDGRQYRTVPGTPDLIAAYTAGTIPHVPQGVVDLIKTRKSRPEQPRSDGSHGPGSGAEHPGVREQAYAEAVLEGCAAELAAVAAGGRNETLNKIAYRMGRMIARGWIDRAAVEAALVGAMHANGYVTGKGVRAVEATLKSGLDAGMGEPHPNLEDRDALPESGGAGQQEQQQEQQHASRVHILEANMVEQKPVSWIWRGRLAAGKLTLIAGDPGTGKSHIGLDIGARITRGTAWPDGSAPRSGNYLILSAEDAANDTICPRLEAAGADLSRVKLLQAVVEPTRRERCFSLQRDLEALGSALANIGDVVAIMIDPITAYMGGIDSHRTTDVRSTLEPLDRFAEAFGVAVFAVTHPPKSSTGKAIHAFTGSLAFVAAARLAFVVVEETETGRSLLLPVKSNLGPKADGIGYRIESATTAKGIPTSRIVWDMTPVYTTANEAVRASNEDARASSSREAEEFLRAYLEAQPMPAEDVIRAAKVAGLSERTLRRAKSKLGILAEKVGYLDGWVWRLP